MTATAILKPGLIAGAIAGGALLLTIAITDGNPPSGGVGMALGYATMLVAMSFAFLGVKRHRDTAGGGVIRFWLAFGMGLAISFVASLVYVLAWEVALATLIQGDFAQQWTELMVAEKVAGGASAAEIAKLRAEMADFGTMYRNPLYRLPLTFIEIFPVGVLVSLISAALLRNSRFLAGRPAAA